MTRTRNLLSALFISPESVFILIGAALYLWSPAFLIGLGAKIKNDGEVWKFFPTIPATLLGYTFVYSAKIRTPFDEKENKILLQWPKFFLIKDRSFVAIFYSILSVAFSLLLWILGLQTDNLIVGIVYPISLFTSGATALTTYLAYQNVRELMELYT